IHRSISHHEDFIWYQSQEQRVDQPQQSMINPDFNQLITKYEGIRRTSFNEISDQDEAFVNNFLAPDKSVIADSFKSRNIYQTNGRGGAVSENGTLLLFNEIQIFVF